jgi:hypothetical protein
MLTYSYNHIIGERFPLVQSLTPPLDPNQGYSHFNLKDIPGFKKSFLSAVRFSCASSSHSRIMNFYYSFGNVPAFNAVTNGTYELVNQVSFW